MDRRRFLLTSLAGALAAPLAAEGQPPGKVPRIAFITTTSPESSTSADAFRQRLREFGYVEGKNIVIEWRWGRSAPLGRRFHTSGPQGAGVSLEIA